MSEEWVPHLVVLAEVVLVAAGFWLYRRRKLRRMTAREKAWILEEEKRARDHFAGRG